jgi:hypothetical protein
MASSESASSAFLVHWPHSHSNLALQISIFSAAISAATANSRQGGVAAFFVVLRDRDPLIAAAAKTTQWLKHHTESHVAAL